MKFLEPLSIRGKLLLAILGTSLSALAIVGITFLAFSWSQSRAALGGQLTTVAALLADRSVAAIAFLDDKTARENLESLRGIPHVRAGCLYDADGRLFATYRATLDRDCAPKIQRLPSAILFAGDEVFAEAQIGRGEGVVQLVSTLNPVKESLKAQLAMGGAGLLLATLISVLLAYYLQRLISRPVIDIRDVAKKIEQSGDYSQRANHAGSDEIADLAQAFNRMLATIESQSADLHASQAKISARVHRVERQRAAIAELSTLESVMRGDLADIADRVARQFGMVLEAARIAVWIYDARTSGLSCHAFASGIAGTSPHAEDATDAMIGIDPLLLNNARHIAISDTWDDARTSAKLDTYFRPNDIRSLLVVGIQSGLQHHGFICFEHRGGTRRWKSDEIAYATALSDQIAITVQNALRVASEEALRENEAYISLLFAESPVPLVVLEPETYRFIDCNLAAVNIYRLGSREAVLGKTPLDVSAPEQYDGRDSASRTRELVEQALAKGSQTFEWRHQRPDGEIWDAEVNLMPFRIRNRQLLQFSLHDITARKQAEKEIRSLNDELEKRVASRTQQLADTNSQLENALDTVRLAQDELVRSEKLASLGALVAGVAHELNTPLGNAFTVSSTLTDVTREFTTAFERGDLKRSLLRQFVDQVAEASDLIDRNLSRASEMIAHFKQVAVDQTSAKRRGFDLCEYIEEIMLTLQPQFKHTPYAVKIQASPGMMMDSFPGPLGQVLTNLVMNSLLHGFEERTHGTVIIQANFAGRDRVKIEVSDDGCGIPKEAVSKIFDPFFTTKLGKGGSGLGLHIVYSIVTRVLGGKISVESDPGTGTVFILEIPVSAPAEAH